VPAPAATVVLVAHGSRVAEANDAHRRLAADLAGRTGGAVIAAFLELAQPDIPAALDEAANGGASRVLVLPYFLLPGAHTTLDLPALVAAARERHPGCRFDQLDHLGADPAVVELLARQVDAASS
jgi:sirohydrochlorin ferrochelatase